MIYLDNNATTPVHPEVIEAMTACWRSPVLNPASQHRAGRRAQQILEDARETIGEILGADPHADQVVFTSGGTEANNLALFGVQPHVAGKVVVSSIEHPSVSAAAEQLERRGVEVARLRVSSSGTVDEDQLRSWLDQSPTRLVSAMLVNNETGVVQPVERLARICREAAVPFHTDAVQAVGKIPVSFGELGVSAMTVAPHKFHGPVGVGALVVRGGLDLAPLHFGGEQQFGLRPGTEPVALVVGMRRALELWRDERDERFARMKRLRNLLEHRVTAGVPAAVVVAHDAPRAPHTSNIAFPGLDRQALLMALDMAGVACSTGSACASGSSQPSPVLVAMGCDEAIVRSSLRFSLSAMTTEEEIEEGARRIVATVKQLSARRSVGPPGDRRTLSR